MERMVVVVFENELKAYDGSRALKALDSEGSISIHAEAVIKKNDDGTIAVKESGADFPIRTVGGTVVGSLIGLLGGPVGLVVGAVGGTFAGAVWDMNHAGVNADFVSEVSARLTPGKWAIVADISEDWVTPVDTRMEALGGTVFRVTRANVEHDQYSKDVAIIKADIAQLKAEQAKSRADQKAKLQTKIDNLNTKLQNKLSQAKLRSEQREKEAKAKVEALEKKAAEAKGEAKATIEKRIAEIEERDQKSDEEFDKWLNGENET
ncbi:MAG TPA: DUF1269 domain-containing protein [Candidatus Nanoarchaeia archaeon]|nr:DUF1269 domain-containing protein [Candidatus Nanoarchaeia archaeon]